MIIITINPYNIYITGKSTKKVQYPDKSHDNKPKILELNGHLQSPRLHLSHTPRALDSSPGQQHISNRMPSLDKLRAQANRPR